jgi:VIT1/CCC1 family predicted Fe2+/Mn2+ transporter
MAGLVAGAMSMAAGEYVSVHSQADTEAADVAREMAELLRDPVGEEAELTTIYVARGLTPALAAEVARQLMLKDAIGAHTSDELGIRAELAAQPLQAAMASAASFALGAALPLLMTLVSPLGYLVAVVAVSALVCLAATGAIAARAGGAPAWAGALRVSFWGAAAMAVTAGVGAWFGAIT